MQNFFRHIIGSVAVLLTMAACTTTQHSAPTPKTTSTSEPTLPPLSHNDSLRFRLYFLQATQQQVAGHFDAAYDLLDHCRQINPNAAEVWFMLSYYDVMTKGDSAALADLKRATTLRPNNSDYLERLATGYLKNNNSDEAIKAYEQLYANNQERSDILNILTQLYSQRKDYDGMLKSLSRLEALEGNSEEIALAKMRVYALQGQKDKELDELRNLCQQHPNDMNFRVMTGNWLLQNGETQQALNEYNYALAQDPENTMAQMSMIDYYRSVGDTVRSDSLQTEMLRNPETPVESKITMVRQVVNDNEKNGGDSSQVINMFRKILSTKQKTTDMAELYVAYMELKRMPQDSIDNALEHILAQAPDNTAARIKLIQSEWNHQNYDRVAELSRQALDYNADIMSFYYFLGLALVQQDKDTEALAALNKATSLDTAKDNPDLLSDCYAISGDILHDLGKAQQAYAAYDSCLQYKDDNFGCLNNYAYYLSEEGVQLPKAEQMSYRTVQAEPDNSTYLDTYAWILFKRKRYAEAAEYIDLAIKNDTARSAVLLEHGGDIYALKGDIDTAMKYWQEAVERGDGDNAILKRKIKQKKYINEK